MGLHGMEPLFFATPKEAVVEITRLLQAEDWPSLARYYALEGTSMSVVGAEFFLRSERPEAAHPRGSWRYRRPFAPGFSYRSHVVEDGVATVEVSISMDQGGGLIQRGFSQFRMRESEQGWQVLP